MRYNTWDTWRILFITLWMHYIVDECFENHELDIYEDFKLLFIGSLQVCIIRCMEEEYFLCRSIDYNDKMGPECKLYKENKYTKPDKYTAKHRESHCTVGMFTHQTRISSLNICISAHLHRLIAKFLWKMTCFAIFPWGRYPVYIYLCVLGLYNTLTPLFGFYWSCFLTPCI